MSSFEIRGGKNLKGEIYPQGAKNEALQVICACLLTDREVIIHNLPDIRDVNKLIELLSELGVTIRRLTSSSVSFRAQQINLDYLRSQDFKENVGSLRGSIMILGPLIARFGMGVVYTPGGDKIGRRRLDTHFIGLQNLGVTFRYDESEKIFIACAS